MSNDDPRRKGQLLFYRTKLLKEVPVYWELQEGELADGRTWILSVSFSEDYEVPKEISDLIFDALLDDSITLEFATEGFMSTCGIYDILEFADTNVIRIGSPNLPMARMKYEEHPRR